MNFFYYKSFWYIIYTLKILRIFQTTGKTTSSLLKEDCSIKKQQSSI